MLLRFLDVKLETLDSWLQLDIRVSHRAFLYSTFASVVLLFYHISLRSVVVATFLALELLHLCGGSSVWFFVDFWSSFCSAEFKS
ncbi:hypothetical protein MUK42_35084 [Musa troglodytarum]|uniref:Uncharacterized protein n=1 Tax=Musa troglodytarum TaxID=320322 RepID=A0A9E7KCA0_9LILI|nr:hypothetical protein MUK42_35084 [Musa troglodytarum]